MGGIKRPEFLNIASFDSGCGGLECGWRHLLAICFVFPGASLDPRYQTSLEVRTMSTRDTCVSLQKIGKTPAGYTPAH